MKLFAVLLNLFLFNCAFGISIPEHLRVPPDMLAEAKKIEDFDFGKEYFIFMYSEEYAKIFNDQHTNIFLDLKKVEKLAPDVLAIGLSVTEIKPKTSARFPK